MKKLILLFVCAAWAVVAVAQTYHEADNAALRAFLSQPSAEAGQTNGERLGLSTADTATWTTDENWVGKIVGLIWNNESPERIDRIDWHSKSLAGTLDLSGCTALMYLGCGNNQLTALDVSTNTALTELYCSRNDLTALNVNRNTALTTLLCFENQLTVLDVSTNTALTGLHCSYNLLTALDVSANTALTILTCPHNALTALDVSANTALTELDCSYNSLTALDVSANTDLIDLVCFDNDLTTLDVSAHTALETLSCYSNQLTTLNFSTNTALTAFLCGDNPLIEVSVGWTTPLVITSVAFEDANLSACILHVPHGTKALYQAADVWKKFGTVLEAGETGARAILPSFEVYASGGNVYINSPVSEQIDAYSIGGALLYRSTKPVGLITIDNLPKGALIVRGSSGWVKKIAK
jgi:Leucine-rich repeat (LRR) protein